MKLNIRQSRWAALLYVTIALGLAGIPRRANVL